MSRKEDQILEYTITYEGEFMRDLYPVPHELEAELDKLYNLALKGKKSGIKKLTNYILKYPRVPALKNYLSVLYKNLNQPEKSFEVNHWIAAEHPEYLFGKLNLAAEHLLKEEYDKIPEVLGTGMELQLLYPERDTFHITEVTSFLKIAVLYFSAIGGLNQAETRLEILQEIASDSEEAETAREHYDMALLKQAFLRREEKKEREIMVKVKNTILTDIEKRPVFINKQINALYENGLSIDSKIITELLELPRQSLIADLNKVLEDSITRYNYFKQLDEEGYYDDRTHSFLCHALFLLGEINASESLGSVLEVLRQDEDYIELYLSELLTEYVWLVLYKITAADLSACKQFMLEPGIYTFSKSEVAEVAVQVALHQPERRKEVVSWFRDVFRFFLSARLTDNVIDSSLLGMLVNSVLDFNGVELLPEIEQLYKNELVDYDSCGDIAAVKKHFAEDKNRNYKRDIIPIFDIYTQIESWHDDYSDTDSTYNESDFPDILPINTGPKIGRNDPCPCGSGKKYKKCCLDKVN